MGGKESHFKERWLILDANYLERQGQFEEAIALLKSISFENQKEITRLVRLAMLSYPESTAEAWNYLSQALKKDPKNSDVRLYRARVLESEGRHSLAVSELDAALKLIQKTFLLEINWLNCMFNIKTTPWLLRSLPMVYNTQFWTPHG